MKPQETKLIREFNKLTREVENTFMTEANDIISDALDKKGNHYYKLILEIKDQIYFIMSKIVDNETKNANEAKLDSKIDELCDFWETIEKQFDKKNLSEEMFNLVTFNIKPKMQEINGVTAKAKMAGFMQAHNIMKLEIGKLYDKMTYFLMRIENESLCDYIELILETFEEIKLKALEKHDEIQNYIDEAESIPDDNKKLHKILDCNKMDKFLVELGYKPIRQKGSHKIYKSEPNGIPVPVPQHSTLNKNLGYEIQKQAFNKK